MNGAPELRGACIAHLSRDWRVQLPPRFAGRFTAGPVVFTLDEDMPCLVLRPAPDDWGGFLQAKPSGRRWSLAKAGTRGRLTVPGELHDALRPLGLKPHAELRLIGQGDYLELWTARAWTATLGRFPGPKLPLDLQ